ncbi:hypothetical protein J6590_035759 [Homalodisca vitripennis]|nr:hypothetical protein J6590_035759 [Homalodisca vitripennis]
MPIPSIYRNFRPLMVFNYIMAQFTSKNVFSETSGSLEFTYCKVPLLSFILQSLIAIKCAAEHLICRYKENIFIITHHSLSLAVDIVAVGWLLLSCGDLIRSFKTIDKLRDTLSRLPVGVEQSSPSLFSWLTFVFLITYQVLFCPMESFGEGLSNFEGNLTVLFTICSFYRASMTLTALFYSSSLVVHDSVRAWRHNRHVNGRPLHSPGDFCYLLMKLSPLFDLLKKTLSVHVLAVILYFNYGVLNDTFYHSYSDHPLFASFFKLMSWCLYLGLLILYVDLKSVQCEDGSRKFEARGFVIVVPQLFLVLFSFAIDYYIICEQNLTFLRQLTSVPDLLNSTRYC